ncbi:ATP-dependent DNA ligase [Microcella sp.]|uniref:DUF7882 family protein n=1 Tax=Microcella sp. TaxID=1913979 RepID=UPI00391DF602
MGQFIYGGSSTNSFEIDDRTLAHLEIAIGTKFRRNESFVLTLRGRELPAGSGYREFWMHPAIWMQFRIDRPTAARPINPAWVAAMVAAASTERGLSLIREP